LAFKINKLKTKYKNMAQYKLESLSLSTALIPYTKRCTQPKKTNRESKNLKVNV